MKFEEVLKQLEPSMAVPMYPKALLIDFMRKAYDEGFKDCAKAKLNVTTISDCPIKNEWHDLRKNPADLPEIKRHYFSKTVITDNGNIAYYDYSDGFWYDWNDDYQLGTEVMPGVIFRNLRSKLCLFGKFA